MIRLIITTILLIATSGLFSQNSGMIKYSESVTLDIQAPDGMDLSDMLPDAMTSEKELIFQNQTSIYQDAKNNESDDVEMESDDGSFHIVLKMDDTENIYFTDHAEKKVIHQTGFMGKEFLIESKLTRPKWKLTNEKIKYLGYVCQKAIRIDEGAGRDGEDRTVVAWFTSEIPQPIGPDDYNMLPGAVLMVSVDEGKTEIKATEVILKDMENIEIAAPKKGKKVTPEEYEEIVAKKQKEMEEMSGGRTRIIRG